MMFAPPRRSRPAPQARPAAWSGLRRAAAQAGVWAAVLAGWLATAGGALAQSAPYTPADDSEIVERLPYRLGAPARDLRRLLARQPGHLPLALQVARDALLRARTEGEPRELGTVQAALAPWWDQPAPPPAVRLLRAAVLQTRHDFDAALADLDALLAARELPPALRAQALLDRAAVLQVQGRFDEAGRTCAELATGPVAALGPAVTLPARACVAELRSLRGDPTADAELRALAAMPGAGGWLALVRAERAVRSGDDAAAEALFRQALALQRDVYTRVAWADWLLDAGRAAEVLTLGAEEDELLPDALLLRRAIALTRLGGAHADRALRAAALLQARFDASRERGDPPHAREEALFALHLRGDAATALALAQRQWALQKEPADALLLVQAARAAGRPEAAAPVRSFVAQTGLSDVRLQQANQGRAR
jgi:tetratricopeptide (TPR) repeat protein